MIQRDLYRYDLKFYIMYVFVRRAFQMCHRRVGVPPGHMICRTLAGRHDLPDSGRTAAPAVALACDAQGPRSECATSQLSGRHDAATRKYGFSLTLPRRNGHAATRAAMRVCRAVPCAVLHAHLRRATDATWDKCVVTVALAISLRAGAAAAAAVCAA